MSASGRPAVHVTRPIPGDGLDRLREVADVDVFPGPLPPPRAALLEAVAEVDGLLCLLTDVIDDELLDAAPRLRVVSTMAVGVDNVDVQALARRGIPLGHTPGLLTDATADLAFSLLLATRRRVAQAAAAIHAGEWVTWDPVFMVGEEVAGSTLGIVGYGRIGRAVARRAAGFSMRLLVHTRTPPDDGAPGVELVDLDRLLAEADVVSLHCPLTPQTRHLIGRAELARMRTTATLINTARGPVVDEEALVAALADGTIASAGLDVVDREPIDLDHPLLSLPNCLVVPHIGSATLQTRTAMADLAVANLVAGLAGEPLPAGYPMPAPEGRAG